MNYIAVVKVEAGRLAKFAAFDDAAAAEAHVARVLDRFPQAYAAPRPAGGPRDWLCDPVAKTLTYAPQPAPPEPPPGDPVLRAFARKHGLAMPTQAEIEAET